MSSRSNFFNKEFYKEEEVDGFIGYGLVMAEISLLLHCKLPVKELVPTRVLVVFFIQHISMCSSEGVFPEFFRAVVAVVNKTRSFTVYVTSYGLFFFLSFLISILPEKSFFKQCCEWPTTKKSFVILSQMV